jgi:hypothetical protein
MADQQDDFDEIVRRLDLDIPFPNESGPETPPAREPEHPSVRRHRHEDEEPVELDDLPDDQDDQFYRRVPPAPIRPHHRGRSLAWAAVLGSPLAIAVATVFQIWLPKSVLLGIGFTFVAGSIYLISQLPEHGPGRPDWPDDGAAI